MTDYSKMTGAERTECALKLERGKQSFISSLRAAFGQLRAPEVDDVEKMTNAVINEMFEKGTLEKAEFSMLGVNEIGDGWWEVEYFYGPSICSVHLKDPRP